MLHKNIFINKTLLVLLILTHCLLLLNTNAIAQEKSLAVICNSNGAPEKISMTELRSVMKGEKQRWNNKTPIVIALMKSTTDAGVNTSKKVFGMSTNEFNKYWLAIVFQQKAKPPVFFHTSAELESFVNETPGAIGIIEAPSSEKPGQISVDGKKTF